MLSFPWLAVWLMVVVSVMFPVEAAPETVRTQQELLTCIRAKQDVDWPVCVNEGLRSTNPVIRGAAIASVYTGLENLTFDVFVPPGDEASSQALQSCDPFYVYGISWDAYGRSFTGSSSGRNAYGQITGDQLSVALRGDCRRLVKNRDGTENVVRDSPRCVVSVQLSEQMVAMEGTVRCQGINVIFRARLGFG